MEKENIKPLLERYLQGNASPSEVELLETWYLDFQGKDDNEIDHAMIEASTNRIWQRLQQSQTKTARLWPRIAVAASLLLAILTAVYFIFRSDHAAIPVVQKYDLPPGKDGATLTLADGRKIPIGEVRSGNIAEESGVRIFKDSVGQLVYEATKQAGDGQAFNILSTASGQQTRLRLPDGSLVFLNAGSSLRYPTHFNGNTKREVSLSGEGYFQVASDRSRPFIVKSQGQQVEVLGTAFNILAYDDRKIRTTLLEGTVAITTGEKKTVLRPGQQALVQDGIISVKEVEAEYEIAWKEGFFLFNGESLEDIMDRIGKWYDVKVVFADPALKGEKFTGTVSRFEHISKALAILEKTKVASFYLSDRTVTVTRRP